MVPKRARLYFQGHRLHSSNHATPASTSWPRRPIVAALVAALLPVVMALSAEEAAGKKARVGQQNSRSGDEIMACGQLFHTTAPVVLWVDPGGYDAYRVERRFSALDKASWEESAKASKYLDTPNRYGIRKSVLTPEQLEQVRGGGWDLTLLQKVVDQFVLHYDVCGTSRRCFQVLHDGRGLSVHFLLDLDGTIYQTLDLKERAWHATIANSRSIGIEIANMGAYSKNNTKVLDGWYTTDPNGTIRLRPPRKFGELGLRSKNYSGRPARQKLISGTIQGTALVQYDFTIEQYDSLIRLTAALCAIFPRIKCAYPADANGKLIPHKLTEDQWNQFHGILGHYHVQKNKVDPGPAFDWDKVIGGAARLIE
jgi:N-acetylmuramoyl-L-alanine amidase